ncbi:MarR family transcriptional regulator [Fructilactobacillus vespulae]|uniref:MarR family winged helix-turn-helix transcriptional regulator n=1 Tax=Fructilactobacillus vespulae TaxID=1249630 RepID=UPI0039B3880F
MKKDSALDGKICFSIYTANKKFNNFYKQVLKQYGLTYQQYMVMFVLWQHEPLSVKQLGKYIDLDSGTLSPLLKRLQKSGWITKSRSLEDERLISIAITEKARKAKNEIINRVNESTEEIGLSRDEIYHAFEIIDNINTHLIRANSQNKN